MLQRIKSLWRTAAYDWKGVVMKKAFDYVSPEVEVILFDSKDVIVTSGGGTLDPEEDIWS